MNLSTIADGEAIIEITLVEYPSPTTFTSIHCYTPLRKITNMSPKTITAENQPNANIATAPIVPPLFVHSSKNGWRGFDYSELGSGGIDGYLTKTT